ncbi:hypothetical protein AM571_PC01689 (plasmid) [Rhizobium etli 8C-3]|uniref:Uncharacterized protein n=1 Tax=Rhizobium etli 8C-3 TaxID=538025 RepID=A0A1L5PHB6_RHIET|nr:hypothetical protein AM571_PC01689 [Rhizobium etli 8C-3]
MAALKGCGPTHFGDLSVPRELISKVFQDRPASSGWATGAVQFRPAGDDDRGQVAL